MEGHARDLAVERGLDLVVYTGTLLVHIVAGVVDFALFCPFCRLTCVYIVRFPNPKTWGKCCLAFILLGVVVVAQF